MPIRRAGRAGQPGAVKDDSAMLNGLYAAAYGMDVAAARHATAAENLAQLQHLGHRRSAAGSERFDRLLDRTNAQARRNGQEPPVDLDPAVDFTSGAYEQTGRSLDVALHGDGFFSVQGPQGTLYTRNGRWRLEPDGQLLTTDGLPVLGPNGPLRLPPGTSAERLRIQNAGGVFADGVQLGRLAIVRIPDPTQLERAGASLFALGPQGTTEPSAAVVEQGAVERSNVAPVTELVALIAASRQYEASQKAIHSLDQAINRRINVAGGR